MLPKRLIRLQLNGRRTTIRIGSAVILCWCATLQAPLGLSQAEFHRGVKTLQRFSTNKALLPETAAYDQENCVLSFAST